jgi:hypothetical protein
VEVDQQPAATVVFVVLGDCLTASLLTVEDYRLTADTPSLFYNGNGMGAAGRRGRAYVGISA